MFRYSKVLVLAPHTDDGELGCGGFINRLIEGGSDVYYAAFSSCEKSVPDGLPKDILKREVKNATKKLGLSEEKLIILNYPVREFSAYRQQILEELIKLKNTIQPNLILCPSLNDIHQDHNVIAHEAVRAFKNYTILGYELPWNNLTICSSCFVKLRKENVMTKIEALKEYTSQEGRLYTKEESIIALAKARGIQINEEYAELFEVIRVVI